MSYDLCSKWKTNFHNNFPIVGSWTYCKVNSLAEAHMERIPTSRSTPTGSSPFSGGLYSEDQRCISHWSAITRVRLSCRWRLSKYFNRGFSWSPVHWGCQEVVKIYEHNNYKFANWFIVECINTFRLIYAAAVWSWMCFVLLLYIL